MCIFEILVGENEIMRRMTLMAENLFANFSELRCKQVKKNLEKVD